MTMNISPLWGLRGLLLVRELRRSEEEDRNGLATGGCRMAGGGSAAANRSEGLPPYVRYCNASRNADRESKRASPAWIVPGIIKAQSPQDDTITLTPLCCRCSSST